jgi:hypothetical protein
MFERKAPDRCHFKDAKQLFLRRVLTNGRQGCDLLLSIMTVPDMSAGRCLGPEGNGVNLEEGGEGGPSSPKSKEDKQSVLSEGRGNIEKEEEEQASRA